MTYESLGRTMRFAAVALAAAVGFATSARAAMTFKGVLDDEGTITFYYDEANHSAEGTVYTHTAGFTGYPPWESNTSIQSAVFTPSCAAFPWTTGLRYFFYGCSSLASVEGLEYVNATSATWLYQMFYGCSSLVSLDAGALVAPNVTDIGAMFQGCSSLETLDISGLSSASITGCDNVFRSCPTLTTIYVQKDFDLSGLANTGNRQWMFFSTSCLVGGNGTKASVAKVTGTSYARIDTAETPGYFTLKTQTLTIAMSEFTEKHIASVAVTLASDGSLVDPDEPGGNVWTFSRWQAFNIVYTAASGYEFAGEETYTDSSFALEGISGDETLEGEEIPTAVARCRLTVDTTAFETLRIASFSVRDASGTALAPESDGSYLLLPGVGFTISYRATAGYAFGHYISATNDTTWASAGILADTAVTPTAKASISLSATQIKGVILDSDPTTMTLYCNDVVYDGIVYARKAATGLTSWSGETNILRVVIDPTMRAYGQSDAGDGFQYLFSGLSGVTNIEGLVNLKTEKAKNMTDMFKNCKSLVLLDLSKMRTPNAMHFGDMFFGCSSLETLDISGFSSASVKGCAGMFRSCSKLKTIYARADFDLDSAESDDWMFAGATGVVGGNGTTAVNQRHCKQFCHVDVPGNPGYFTLKPRRGALLLFR